MQVCNLTDFPAIRAILAVWDATFATAVQAWAFAGVVAQVYGARSKAAAEDWR